MPPETVQIRAVRGIPEVRPGDDLCAFIMQGLGSDGICPREGSIFVIAQKVVSKAEGCIVDLQTVIPSTRAAQWALRHRRDPRLTEVVLRQAKRIVRMDRGVIIAETRHGYVCANAGVDASNAPAGTVTLLPEDPDRSALRLREQLERSLGVQLGVIISDTFGRPWRQGLTNVALGVSGLSPFVDYRGKVDSCGRVLHATLLAAADELAAAAELVMGKTSGIPVAVIEGMPHEGVDGSGRDILRPGEEDLFR